ncbi:septum formation initiator family protein [Microbacterium gorillae]|uniref:septum formation initiator family protein n=1 Tax=Microbacterium gorillae TaxID=1231063 RepID=UPI0018A87768|nr:septum formation initiator family protein [Microbacterium gorillae]
MAKRPDLPSLLSAAPDAPKSRTAEARATASRRTTRGPGGARAVDVREWLGGIRLSAFMMIMLGLVLVAVLVLVPTIATFIDQRQRIVSLQNAVQVAQSRVDELSAERDRWHDKAYITTQARERLYYVEPGEVVFLVVDDRDPAKQPAEQKPVSDTVQQADGDWMANLLRTVTDSGLAKTAVPEQTGSTPAPKPSPSE